MINRKQAQEILGVTEKSLQSDIDMRYATLVKRYRAEQDNEKLEEISLAYNIITGRYIAPVEEIPQKNNLIFGKTRKQWSNIWYYGKLKYFFIFLIAVFVVYMIYTIITNTPADFKIAAVGEFSIAGDNKITEDYAKKLFPEFEKVDVTLVYLSEVAGGGEYGAANAQRALIILTVSGEDLIVVDSATFNKYAPLGAFKPIDELYDTIIDIDKPKPLSIRSMKSTIKTEADDDIEKEMIYGINVSDSQLLNAIGIYGRDQILTISIKSKREALTKDFIIKLFNDTAQLLPKVTLIPSLMPSITPKPTVTPTIVVLPAN